MPVRKVVESLMNVATPMNLRPRRRAKLERKEEKQHTRAVRLTSSVQMKLAKPVAKVDAPDISIFFMLEYSSNGSCREDS